MVRPRSIAIIAHSPRTVRIALGDSSVEAGGAELQLAWTGQVLRECSWQVRFIVPQTGEECPFGDHQGFSIVPAHRPGRARGAIGYLTGTVRDYWRALEEADASIYLHRGATGLAGWTALFCKVRRRLCALSVAANSDVDPSMETGEGSSSARDRLSYAYYLRNCAVIFAQSPEQSALLRANYGRESVWAPNIASIPDFAPGKNAEPLVVWAGAIRGAKRPLLALEVARSLPDTHFLIAGGPNPGMDDLWAEVQRQAGALPNVELLGWLSVGEVEELIGRAWVLLCTSQMEGFPNVYLMAWGRETPVVTSFGAGDLVADSGAGFVGQTVERLAAAVQQLVSDDHLRAEMGVSGRRYVQEHHSREVVGDVYDRAFTALLDPRQIRFPGSPKGKRRSSST